MNRVPSMSRLTSLDHKGLNGSGEQHAAKSPILTHPGPMETVRAVVLAGGRGARLRPYTFVLPKPLIPVGQEPVLGLLLKQLRRYGIRDVTLTLGYSAGVIRALLSNGLGTGLNIECVEESVPLGTIGSLRLVANQLDNTFLVANGDILTDLNLRDMVAFHNRNNAVATIACHRRMSTVPYGVIKAGRKGEIRSFMEKPIRYDLVSMGVYVFSPTILPLIPEDTPFGADDLIHTILERKLPAFTYVHRGLWMDIGQVQDLQEAQVYYEGNRERLIGD